MTDTPTKEEIQAALLDYGQHLTGCPARRTAMEIDPCECGFADIRRALTTAAPSTPPPVDHDMAHEFALEVLKINPPFMLARAYLALAAERDALRARVDLIQAQLVKTDAGYVAAEERANRAEADVKRLIAERDAERSRVAYGEVRANRAEAALRKYGRHLNSCDIERHSGTYVVFPPCSCGLAEVAP